jgi:hypothetical protein
MSWHVKHQTPNTKHQTPTTKHQTPNTKHQTPNTKHYTPKKQTPTPNTINASGHKARNCPTCQPDPGRIPQVRFFVPTSSACAKFEQKEQLLGDEQEKGSEQIKPVFPVQVGDESCDPLSRKPACS